MPDLFVDTAGWGHLVDPSQRFHRLAAETGSTLRSKHTVADHSRGGLERVGISSRKAPIRSVAKGVLEAFGVGGW